MGLFGVVRLLVFVAVVVVVVVVAATVTEGILGMLTGLRVQL